MPFFSSSRLAYHCEYKTTAMLCSSGAKENWQCKLTAVIRRQPCSVAVAPKLSHLSHQCKACSLAMTPASVCMSCHTGLPPWTGAALNRIHWSCRRRSSLLRLFMRCCMAGVTVPSQRMILASGCQRMCSPLDVVSKMSKRGLLKLGGLESTSF